MHTGNRQKGSTYQLFRGNPVYYFASSSSYTEFARTQCPTLTKRYFPTSAAEITVKLTGDLHKKNFVMPSATCRKKAPYDTSEKDHMFVIWHHHSCSLSHRKCFTSSFVTDSLFHRVLHNMLN